MPHCIVCDRPAPVGWPVEDAGIVCAPATRPECKERAERRAEQKWMVADETAGPVVR